MTTAPAEKSKLVEAINTVESKKKEAIVWNDELLVWYAREKDAAARKSKSIVRRIAETTYHLISRLVCLLMLKFYGMVWSVLNYAMKLRPATKLPSSTVSASSSSASLGSAEVAVQEEETEVAVMAKESTSVKTEGSISVQTEVKPKGKEVGKEEVKLGFSKPASAQELEQMAQVRSELAALTSEEKEGMSSAWLERLQQKEMGYELLSYLRKARGSPRVCRELILNSARWRIEFGVEQILEEEDLTIEAFFQGQVHEVDWLPADADSVGGRNPVLLYRSAKHVPLDIPTERWLRFFVRQCEHARLTHPQKQVAILVDRVGSGRKNQDPTVLRALSPIIADHYPLLIGRVYIAPVNTVLFIIWRLVSLILDEETKSTIQLVQGEGWKESLAEVLEPTALPVRLGGSNEDF